jgi:hypothetical protein
MENIIIEATNNTPQVDFNFTENRLFIGGESYSEEAAEIFEALFSSIRQYLSEGDTKNIDLICEWIYFNSFTARKLYELFSLMDGCVDDGHTVTIIWLYRSFDDNMHEFGEELGDDLENAQFILKETSDD